MKAQLIRIDFDSDEALYMQLCNQIIYGIATNMIHEGDALPSVRQMAELVGINMHTVNKAYGVLRSEGILNIDRRRGAVVAIDADRLYALAQLKDELKIVIARALCRGIAPEEVHQLIDEIYLDYMTQRNASLF